MSLLRAPSVSLLAVCFASLVACGGAVDSPRSQTTDTVSPGAPSGNESNASGSRGTCTLAPSCKPGETQVGSKSGCFQDDAVCYERSSCGQTIWCTQSTCEGPAPICPPDSMRVSSCQGYEGCVTRSVCGYSISCAPDPSQCDGYPGCNAGDTQVPSSSQCLQDDASCYQRSACGITIWCTGPLPQDAGAPVPPPAPAP